MSKSNTNLNSKLTDATDISKRWDKDNQAWWDWYVSLAHNDVKENEIIKADPLPDAEDLVHPDRADERCDNRACERQIGTAWSQPGDAPVPDIIGESGAEEDQPGIARKRGAVAARELPAARRRRWCRRAGRGCGSTSDHENGSC